jgi:hypothetical protein
MSIRTWVARAALVTTMLVATASAVAQTAVFTCRDSNNPGSPADVYRLDYDGKTVTFSTGATVPVRMSSDEIVWTTAPYQTTFTLNRFSGQLTLSTPGRGSRTYTCRTEEKKF